MNRFFFYLFFFSSLSSSAINEWKRKPAFEERCFQKEMISGGTHLIVNVKFILRTGAMEYFFTDRGYFVVQHSDSLHENTTWFLFPDSNDPEDFAGYIPEGINIIPTRTNYYNGNSFANIRSFEKIVYRNIWDGCTLEFSVNGNFLERKLTVRPGAYDHNTEFEIAGSNVAPLVSETEAGYLFFNDAGSFSEFLVNNNSRLQVIEANEFSEWTPGVIKPRYHISERNGDPGTQSATLTWLTYLGGNSADELFGACVTPDSGAVVTGRTGSADFPSSPGSFQDTLHASYDAVVCRFASNGNCLWSTYYGGNNFDGAYAVAKFDSLYAICGMSSSTDLPMMNAPQNTNGGSYDAFIVMLNDSGQLVRSTYFGGTGSDQAFSIARDTSGRIVIAGSSTSTDLPFAFTGYQQTLSGAVDAFIGVFSASLNPVWISYYGGTNTEDIHSVTVTPQGEIVFVGGTYSINFPVTLDAFQNGMITQPDVYLVKFSMSGTRLYSTFFGGSNTEDCNAVVSDSSGALYISGFTYSIDFPIQGNSFQSIKSAQSDVFVSKFDPSGQLIWSTFIGGNDVDNGFAMDRLGKYIFICGNTQSSNFPVSANAIQNIYGGISDGFVIKMDTSGNMISGTFMGGNGTDALYGECVTRDTSVIACGDTYSTNLAVTPGAYQMTNHSNGDGYVVKFPMREQLINMTTNDGGASLNTLVIFPVPAHDVLNFIYNETDQVRTYRIIDENGRIVGEVTSGKNLQQLEVSNYANGYYELALYNENGALLKTIPFIKK
ncbi:MAG: SBBP repeat-containing protein [Bacteroidetes bacterium]|nr:SBBP repeat-containing protein [Bacteroidota bacterium]